MPGKAFDTPRVTLSPAHLVRAGSGIDAVRLQARGLGFVFGSLGLFRVKGSLEVLVLRQFKPRTLRVFFFGLHGLAWAFVQLPRARRASIPAVRGLRAPTFPPAPSLPSLEVQLDIHTPQPPSL